MRKSHVIAKLEQKQPAWCVAISMSDFTLFEVAGLTGVDGIWLDLEHHGFSVESAAHLICGARAGDTDVIARPGKGEFMRLGRMLEMGATGIMYPRCDDPEEAAEVVKWSKFAPLGVRGYDGSNPDMPYMSIPKAEYIQQANKETFIIVQVEHPSAVDQAEAIAAVDGVDFLMLGPGDFSILSGIPEAGYSHPKMQMAIDTISKAAKNTGKSWAALAFSLDDVRQFVAAGAGLIFYGSAMRAVRDHFASTREALLNEGFALRDSQI